MKSRVDGVIAEENKVVTVSVEGIAAGREPRAAAEELRQLLLEQLGRSYTEVKVEFKTLEDLHSGDVQLNIVKWGHHRLSKPHEIETIIRTILTMAEKIR